MSRIIPPASEQAGDPASGRTAAEQSQVNGSAAVNGEPGHEASPNPAPADPAAEATRTQRAEEIVDRLAVRVGNFTSVWGRRLLRVTSRIREEAQDIWAEAQSIRRGDQP
jgi:hypothetical protein